MKRPVLPRPDYRRLLSDPLHWLLIVLLCLQLAYWQRMHGIRPELTIVPDLPSKAEVAFESLGDDEWYFRIHALELQSFGDTFGRFTPLKNYDYSKLAGWMHLLDSKNSDSNHIPTLAGHYFSQTQHEKDLYYIVRYLEQHADQHPESKWRWYANAVYLANHKLKDRMLALRLAYKLREVPGEIPPWARQMPAFIHEQMGERESAYRIMEKILQDDDKLTPEEMNYINYFMKERMRELEAPEPAAD